MSKPENTDLTEHNWQWSFQTAREENKLDYIKEDPFMADNNNIF